ncbi:bifunctional response regulator/alkaline phosphatase family protein [Marinoscillum sp. 108]|uniref:PglZ domain-containing protein n=1 Tax=Marinoscillum luteum TaxID=861051 RepID=A0ABW7NEE0_9BACT|nr:bifunctional response regulator/alkaline phosphatase family protein [Marinoscillum sp. 108]VXD13487.1 Response regulator receiver domain-containing protein [Marinoscillum sp. 108]
MQKYRILWADDEIDLLKPHILFLSNKGFEITPVNSGSDALEEIDHHTFDLVFLDENMPGMSGLETLNYIKSTHPNLPVVMITKSEEEHIMEEAIGAKIADYLIKPLNPNQILLSVKKILDNKRIVSEHTNQSYQQEFQKLSMTVQDLDDFEGWADLYRKLVYWDLEIDSTDDKSMLEVLNTQRSEANQRFSDFIVDNYRDWITDPDVDRPLLSHQVLKKKVFPLLKSEKPVFLIVIDNLRFDQWEILEPEISELFNIVNKDYYYSILPTTTAYARNALFAGQMPLDIAKNHPDLWVGEDDEDGKNLYEEQLLMKNLEKERLQVKASYHKIIKASDGKNLTDNVKNLMKNDFNAIVFNFVDMLSHARTDMQMIRELAPDESAYRSITKSWFSHSSLYDLLRYLSGKDVKVVITTDHGTIRVKKPYKIVGDRNTNTNLRYKAGRNLAFEEKGVLFTRDPDEFRLPKVNVSTAFAFAREDFFFAYPNNYNYYVNFYKDTFQHGGVSMEEMIIPLVELAPK